MTDRKLRIGIYAPALNESKNAQAWADSCKEADYRYVIDTGSKDNTKEILQANGVVVHDVLISPWRFDDAYNIAMSLLPADTDVCICLHMDERLCADWREIIEQSWTPGITRLRYTYIWNWNPDGTPGRTWSGDRIHSRGGYRWMGATHEGLCVRYQFNEISTENKELKILHFPDAKDKSGDLRLLEESVNEYPHDARIRAYLGREYMYKGDNVNATKTYKEFLTMSWDKAERGQAMVNLSKTDSDNKIFWLKMANVEVPTHREPLVELAQHYYNAADWVNCYKHAREALDITNHPMDYTCTPEAWGAQPHDLLSIAAWNLKLFKESLEHSRIALSKNLGDVRLQSNLQSIEDFFVNYGIPKD